jgi:DNA/RNA non-specific endonuclease
LLTIKCAGSNKFWVQGFSEAVPLHCFSCSAKSSTEVVAAGNDKDCSNGTMKSIGFNVHGKPHKSLYRSCIDLSTKQVHWVEHFLNGWGTIAKASKPISSTWDKNGFTGVQDGRNLDKDYKKEEQVKNRLINNSNSENYLARGHLFPDADGVFRSQRRATYSYLNAVPQWQSINNGNWKALENRIREEYHGAGVKRIRTGGYGNVRNSPQLSPNGPPIPRWIYKKVYISNNEYYLFNVYNHPHRKFLVW